MTDREKQQDDLLGAKIKDQELQLKQQRKEIDELREINRRRLQKLREIENILLKGMRE